MRFGTAGRGTARQGEAGRGKAGHGYFHMESGLTIKGVKMETDISKKVESIVSRLLDMDPSAEDFTMTGFEVRVKQANVGLSYNRDTAMNERIKQGQMLRIIGMISTDPEVREQYIRDTQPSLPLKLLGRPKKSKG